MITFLYNYCADHSIITAFGPDAYDALQLDKTNYNVGQLFLLMDNYSSTESDGETTYSGNLYLMRKQEEFTYSNLDETYEQKFDRRINDLEAKLRGIFAEIECEVDCQVNSITYEHVINNQDLNMDGVRASFNLTIGDIADFESIPSQYDELEERVEKLEDCCDELHSVVSVSQDPNTLAVNGKLLKKREDRDVYDEIKSVDVSSSYTSGQQIATVVIDGKTKPIYVRESIFLDGVFSPNRQLLFKMDETNGILQVSFDKGITWKTVVLKDPYRKPFVSGHVNQSGGTFSFYINRTGSTQGGTTVTVPVGTDGYFEWNNEQGYNITSLAGMFYQKKLLTYVSFGKEFDTSNVTSMSSMFRDCSALSSVDLSDFDTSNVTSMSSMFRGCSALSSVDLSDFDTSKVTNMTDMFYGCKALSSVDLSNWDTSNVTNMTDMFSGCYALSSVDLSNWDTSKVTTMYGMFHGCSVLTSVGDLSNWNTGRVTNMQSMFESCYALSSVDLSNWDTSKVTNMQYMFRDCSALTHLKLDNWKTTQVTTYTAFVPNVSTLTIDYNSSKWNTAIPTAFPNVNWHSVE